LGSVLKAKGKTIATAESCTGGKIGDMITSVPGSSAYFLGGVVSYGNDAKVSLLGVDTGALKADGAVSEMVARQMADGAREMFGADVGISTTGIAGPGGGSAEKPVGLVFVAVSTSDMSLCRRYVFTGARDDIKTRSANAALALALELLADAK